jgi:O-methyltransferase
MTVQDAMTTALRNSPRHIGRLAKLYGVLGYNALYHWASDRNRRFVEGSVQEQDQDGLASINRKITANLGEIQSLSEHMKRWFDRPRENCFSSTTIQIDAALRDIDHLSRQYRDEDVIKRFVKAVHGYTMVGYDGLAILAEQVRHCEENNIPGDYVELGTWQGGCLGIMALSNLTWGRERRTIHGFDSFEGIPLPRRDKDDMQWAAIMNIKEDDCDGRLENCNCLVGARAALDELITKIAYPVDHVRVHQGWFQNTVPLATDIEKIAILRIDGDLYESYMVALDHLYDRVQPGGFVIFDDWGIEGCRNAVNEFFAKRNLRPFLSYVDYGVRYFQKPSDQGRP